MIITTIINIFTKLIQIPSNIINKIPNIKPTFNTTFKTFKNPNQLLTIQFLIIILTFLFINFFNTTNTLITITTQTNIIKNNKLPKTNKTLFSNSLTTIIRSIFKTTTTTSYIKSTSNITINTKTKFTNIITNYYFLLTLFFNPLITIITNTITTPTLIIINILITTNFTKIN